jgi:hypothetical protein
MCHVVSFSCYGLGVLGSTILVLGNEIWPGHNSKMFGTFTGLNRGALSPVDFSVWTVFYVLSTNIYKSKGGKGSSS